MEKTERVTTKEASRFLGVKPAEGLVLLKAARVPVTRCGSGFLWDVQAVTALAEAIKRGTRS